MTMMLIIMIIAIIQIIISCKLVNILITIIAIVITTKAWEERSAYCHCAQTCTRLGVWGAMRRLIALR